MAISMRDIFDIRIDFENYSEMKNSEQIVKIISFGGICDSKYFQGKVMSGGTDVQILKKDGTGTVSARYILEGTDRSGARCKVYVANEGIIDIAGQMQTNPKILTDSRELSWLHTEKMQCRFETREEEFHVIIYGE